MIKAPDEIFAEVQKLAQMSRDPSVSQLDQAGIAYAADALMWVITDSAEPVSTFVVQKR